MEVIVTRKLVYFTYLGDEFQPTYTGVRTSNYIQYQQDILVKLPFLLLEALAIFRGKLVPATQKTPGSMVKLTNWILIYSDCT